MWQFVLRDESKGDENYVENKCSLFVVDMENTRSLQQQYDQTYLQLRCKILKHLNPISALVT